MVRLYLLRHAKAQWPAPGTRDFDRPLDATGRADAAGMGALMKARGLVPAQALCSTARRARETWEAAAPHLAVSDVSFTDALYSSDSAGYVDLIRDFDGEEALLVIGHNPMMEDIAFALAREGSADAMEHVASGFPTCGLAVLRFSRPLAEIGPRDGYLEDFFSPRHG